MAKRILIIEDEQHLRETLSDIIEVNGYEVLSANDGEAGCHVAVREKPDLIICDVNMPKMDGFEVLQMLKSTMEERMVPPFIYLTAKVERADIRRGMRLGAEDYITKPFSNKEILEAIESRLSKREEFQDSVLKSEREKMATELHNSIQQLMAAAHFGLQRFSRKNNSMPEKDKKTIEKLQNIIEQAIQESRSLAHRLIPKDIEDYGLEKFVNVLQQQIALSGEIKFECHYELKKRLPLELELFVCRSIQESTSNILKYAMADSIQLDIRESEDYRSVVCTMKDNGKGFDTARNYEGVGLRSTREKAEKLGGSFEITSSPGKGTCSRLEVPIKLTLS